jgi:membrane-bound lytic murein transglycosylase B
VLHLDNTQPEKRLSFMTYRNTRADRARILLGQTEVARYQNLLGNVENHYGVNACVIASLWGMETSYGHYVGNFSTLQALATLAYSSRRADFFRNELLDALGILGSNQVSLHDFKGEWAGGTGQPQFLPSSWYQYAVDYNGDGRKDIWKTPVDVFASIANYLVQNGWKTGEPVMVSVSVPEGIAGSINSKQEQSVSAWQQQGVQIMDGRSWPDGGLTAQLIQPDGGPVFLVFPNFFTLMRWNHSTYYVGTINYLAEQICERPL